MSQVGDRAGKALLLEPPRRWRVYCRGRLAWWAADKSKAPSSMSSPSAAIMAVCGGSGN